MPRPAVVIQSQWLDDVTDGVLVCPLTTTSRDASFFRLDITPSPANSLRAPSQIMADKIVAVRRDRCGTVIGQLDDAALLALNRMLALAVGLVD